MTDWNCTDCAWVKLGDYCVCPQTATDTDCHCTELKLMSAPGDNWRNGQSK